MLCVLNDTGRKILAEYACGLPTLAVHGARLSQEAGGGSLWNELGVQLSRAGAMKQAVQAFRVAVESLESALAIAQKQPAQLLSEQQAPLPDTLPTGLTVYARTCVCQVSLFISLCSRSSAAPAIRSTAGVLEGAAAPPRSWPSTTPP